MAVAQVVEPHTSQFGAFQDLLEVTPREVPHVERPAVVQAEHQVHGYGVRRAQQPAPFRLLIV